MNEGLFIECGIQFVRRVCCLMAGMRFVQERAFIGI